MMPNHVRANPIRYSMWLMLLLTLCLLFAEHQSPVQVQNIDLDYIVSKQSGSLSREVAYLTIGLIGVIGCYYVLIVQRIKLRWNPRFTIFLALLLGWTTLSLLWTDMPMITSKRLVVLGLMFLGALGVLLSWTRTECLRFMALSSAIQISIGIGAEILYGYFTPYHADYRFSGTLTANSQSYVCLVCTLSAMCMARLREPGQRVYQGLAAFGFIFLLLTRSRGGLLAFALASTLYLLVTLAPRLRVMAFLLAATTAVLLIISGAAPTLLNALNRGGEGGSDFNGRAPLWEDLMSYVGHRPLAGYGYEGFWTVNRIDDVSADQLWGIDQAHSGYIEGLLELGWIGATLHTLVLLVGVVEGVRLFRRTNDYAYILAAALCFVYLAGGLLEALFIVKTSQSSYYLTLLILLLAVQPEASTAQILKKRRQLAEPGSSLYLR